MWGLLMVQQLLILIPFPDRIDDVLTSMTGAKVFSKLDLSHAYLQLQVEEVSKEFAL